MGVLLNSKYNQFILKFDKGFFTEAVEKKYNRKLRRHPDIFESIQDLVEHSIQGFSLNDLGADSVQQEGTIRKYSTPFRQGANLELLENGSRNLDITFKFTESYLNYFALMDLLYDYWAVPTKGPAKYFPAINLIFLDAYGFEVGHWRFEDILFKKMSALDVSYTTNVQEFKSFNCSFDYKYRRWLDDGMDSTEGIELDFPYKNREQMDLLLSKS